MHNFPIFQFFWNFINFLNEMKPQKCKKKKKKRKKKKKKLTISSLLRALNFKPNMYHCEMNLNWKSLSEIALEKLFSRSFIICLLFYKKTYHFLKKVDNTLTREVPYVFVCLRFFVPLEKNFHSLGDVTNTGDRLQFLPILSTYLLVRVL